MAEPRRIRADEGFAISFGKHRELPWPFYIAWHFGSEMFIPMREDDDNWDGGYYCDRYYARRAVLAWIERGVVTIPADHPA